MMNISVIDDHPLLAMGIECVCQSIGWVKVCNVYYSLDSFIDNTMCGDVDIIILDMRLSSTDGSHAQVVNKLKKYVPDAKILSVGGGHYERDRHEALRSGSHGFASKTESLKSLKEKIENVCKGNFGSKLPVRIGTDMLATRPLAADLEIYVTLTISEKRVLRGLMEGFSITSLAQIHKRSVKTISSQKRSLMKKVGAQTDMDLFKIFSFSSVPGLACADFSHLNKSIMFSSKGFSNERLSLI